ncbi:YwpF family protein [Oceanobacillus halotolerans]|uniref:YwpF family protein n=1 Tax=Oceanobacillus halotolerans TaxID=2663380 RepID=UPI0013DCEFD3|nr:YwpF family protein [Oceanobacillus halotolerans]
MKTFKLKSLEIIENKEEDIVQHDIQIIDGLAINREDDENRWIIEVYVDKTYMDFFRRLQQQQEDVMIQVKITKETNPPATFLTSVIGINEIGENINVLFMGIMIDEQKSIIKDLLKTLIEEGYQGVSLLEKFKERI